MRNISTHFLPHELTFETTIKDGIARLSGSQGQSPNTSFKGFINMYMWIKFEVDTTYGFLDIKANAKMLTDSKQCTI